MNAETTAAWVACRNGDVAACQVFVGILFRWWHRLVAMTERRRAVPFHDAQDAAGEAFLRIWQAVIAPDTPAPKNGWFWHLYDLVVAALRTMTRRAARRLQSPRQALQDLWDRIPDKAGFLRLLRGMMARLSRLERRVMFAQLRGLSHREIATRLDITPDTSRTLLARARAKLAHESRSVYSHTSKEARCKTP